MSKQVSLSQNAATVFSYEIHLIEGSLMEPLRTLLERMLNEIEADNKGGWWKRHDEYRSPNHPDPLYPTLTIPCQVIRTDPTSGERRAFPTDINYDVMLDWEWKERSETERRVKWRYKSSVWDDLEASKLGDQALAAAPEPSRMPTAVMKGTELSVLFGEAVGSLAIRLNSTRTAVTKYFSDLDLESMNGSHQLQTAGSKFKFSVWDIPVRAQGNASNAALLDIEITRDPISVIDADWDKATVTHPGSDAHASIKPMIA